jgi:hypothetical protein
MSHTPGPWVVDGLAPPPGKRKRHHLPDLLMVVAEAGGMPGILVSQGAIEPRDIANANLIAAAPDLLEVLREVLPLLDHVAGVGLEACDAAKLVPAAEVKARAAIAKAEGK